MQSKSRLGPASSRVALVTGGSSGIGEATAIEFAQAGFRVAITGRDGVRLNKVIENLKNSTPIKTDQDTLFLALEANFEELTQVEPLVDQVIAKFGQIDVLVNNAGYLGESRDLWHKEFFTDFQNIMQVNLMAVARLTQLAAPHLMKSQRGVVINISSVLDRMAYPNISYCISKAGLAMLTKTFANEFEGTNVRVVAVAPGPVSTRISPAIDTLACTTSLGRMASSSEIAKVVTFLESEKASFVHGSTFDVDGGYLARVGLVGCPGYKPKIRTNEQDSTS